MALILSRLGFRVWGFRVIFILSRLGFGVWGFWVDFYTFAIRLWGLGVRVVFVLSR